MSRKEYERQRKLNRTPEQKEKELQKQRVWWKENKHRYKHHKQRRSDRKEEYKRYHIKLKQNASNGKCRRSFHCQDPLAGVTKYCLKHWCSLIKNNNHGKKKSKIDVDLLELWNEQQGRCYITNILLVPGKTASLEHLQPISKGGDNSKENLKFVHASVNCMKQDATEEEFRELLKELVPKLTDYINKEKSHGL